MIHVIDDIYIDDAGNCYAVGKRIERPKKDGGTETVIQNPRYYKDFAGALGCVRNILQHRTLSAFEGELKDAIAAIRESDARFAEIVKGVLECE